MTFSLRRRADTLLAAMRAGLPDRSARQMFRIVMSPDLDNLGGHSHQRYHYTSAHPLRRHEPAAP
jgi:hypothetical protein